MKTTLADKKVYWSENMKYLFIGLFIGSLSGLFIPRFMAKSEVRYSVGACLSNGLYYERIMAVRKSALTHEAIYDLLPTIQGKLSAPDSTVAWIVHDGYVQVSKQNCL